MDLNINIEAADRWASPATPFVVPVLAYGLYEWWTWAGFLIADGLVVLMVPAFPTSKGRKNLR